MNSNLLETLKAHFGTVSGQTATGGTVAVRNVTAYRKLAIIVEPFNATLTDKTSNYPKLVRVEVAE